MSNKSISVYAEAIRLQQEGQQKAQASIPPRSIQVENASTSSTDSSKPEQNKPTNTTTSRHHDTVVSRSQDTATPRNRDSTKPWYHGITLDKVRRAVRDFGKEAATYRFTTTEKRAMANIVHAFKMEGIKTSENEITRIALNLVIGDQELFGEDSALSRVIRKLNE